MPIKMTYVSISFTTTRQDDDNNKRQQQQAERDGERERERARRAQSENFNFIFIALLCIKYLQLFAMSHENEPFQPRRWMEEHGMEDATDGRVDGRVHADKFK